VFTYLSLLDAIVKYIEYQFVLYTFVFRSIKTNISDTQALFDFNIGGRMTVSYIHIRRNISLSDAMNCKE